MAERTTSSALEANRLWSHQRCRRWPGELDARAAANPQPTDLTPGPFSPEDPRITAVDWVDVDENGYPNITYRNRTGSADEAALMNELAAEAQSARVPTAGEIA